MKPEEFKRKMKSIVREARHSRDFEASHAEADALMCEMLESLGYGDGVKIFKNMEKHYA